MYRSSDEMTKSRKLTELTNKTWYKSKRGGQRITPGKNIPRVSLDKEVTARKDHKREVEQRKSGEPRGSETEASPGKIKEVETIVFVPAMPDSCLRKLLQTQDEGLCRTTNTPTARFVERGGTTLIEMVGRNNPWAKEWSCPRDNCYP